MEQPSGSAGPPHVEINTPRSVAESINTMESYHIEGSPIQQQAWALLDSLPEEHMQQFVLLTLADAEKVLKENGVTKHVSRKLMESWSVTRWGYIAKALRWHEKKYNMQQVYEQFLMDTDAYMPPFLR